MTRVKTALRQLWIEIRKLIQDPRLIGPVAKGVLKDIGATVIPGPLPPDVRWPIIVVGPAYTLVLVVSGWVPDPAFLMALAATWAAGVVAVRRAGRMLTSQIARNETKSLLREIRLMATRKPESDQPAVEGLEAEMWVYAVRGDRSRFDQAQRQHAEMIWSCSRSK